MKEKPFKTHVQQVNILRKKGMIVPQGYGVEVLKRENYYNIINGYKDLFIDVPKTQTTSEKYKAGTQFDEIVALYKFDCELKSIFLKRLLRIENEIKSLIAYNFSEEYAYNNNCSITNTNCFKMNTNCYTNIENFSLIPVGRESLEKRLSGVIDLIASLHKATAKALSKPSSAVKHYMEEYGYVPLWVLMEVVTFGTVSFFYRYMKQKDKQKISSVYKISDNEMEIILKNLSLVRNLCAHDERLYNFRLKQPIKVMPIHRALAIPIDSRSGNPICGRKDLFSILISFKILRNQDDMDDIVDELKEIISQLTAQLKTININDVLDKMGFPSNWDNIKTI